MTETTVTCVSENDAELDGLLTVFHQERSSSMGEIENEQNQQPLFAEADITALKRIVAKNYDVDFISLSYTRDKQDIKDARNVWKGYEEGCGGLLWKVCYQEFLWGCFVRAAVECSGFDLASFMTPGVVPGC